MDSVTTSTSKLFSEFEDMFLMSMLFILTGKISFKNECPLLSAKDIREIISIT
ncbi:hypothetical protein [Parasediminibacterium sp. JCM 36343]|uniref:hypothetical protein n=1 Tax=Parasediminibacterium sp. JCM 36343 TaxID=3374279 RepID=UPI0039790DF4